MRYYYLRDSKNIQTKADGSLTKGNPICVIASEIDRERNVIRYALASVHPKDNFVRSRALDIARGRLAKRPVVINGCPKTGREISHKIISHIYGCDENVVPRVVRKLARNWLSDIERYRKANTVQS